VKELFKQLLDDCNSAASSSSFSHRKNNAKDPIRVSLVSKDRPSKAAQPFLTTPSSTPTIIY